MLNIDNCCNLKDHIKSVFGPNIAVKLDLFPAMQRITKTFPKRHKLHHQCVLDLRKVFREDGDSGISRISTTPSPEKMLKKMRKISGTHGKTRLILMVEEYGMQRVVML